MKTEQPYDLLNSFGKDISQISTPIHDLKKTTNKTILSKLGKEEKPP